MKINTNQQPQSEEGYLVFVYVRRLFTEGGAAFLKYPMQTDILGEIDR